MENKPRGLKCSKEKQFIILSDAAYVKLILVKKTLKTLSALVLLQLELMQRGECLIISHWNDEEKEEDDGNCCI